MSFEVAGVAALLIGLYALRRPPEMCLILVLVSTMFGTAAAMNLPALGGSSILVANFIAIFMMLRLFLYGGPATFVQPLTRDAAGIALLVFAAYALFSAYFFPRYFVGVTDTVSIATASTGVKIISFQPLFPKPQNITQSAYLVGGVATYCCVHSYFAVNNSFSALFRGLFLLVTLHLLATVADVMTYYSGTAELLDPIRNANYAYQTGVEKMGLKRLTAFFSEASAFAGYTLIMFAFTFSLWLDRIRTGVTGRLSLGLFVGLVLSTSGSGYVALCVVYLLMMTFKVFRPSSGNGFNHASIFMMVTIVAMAAAILTLLYIPGQLETFRNFADDTVFGKLESSSGQERSLWNTTAYQNFLDTDGFGAGLGSARASSLFLVLLSNLGVIGTLLFLIWLGLILFTRVDASLGHERVAAVAAMRWSLVATLIIATLAKTDFDFGLLFYILAGAVAASLARQPERFGERVQPTGRIG